MLKAVRDSGGTALLCNDDELRAAQADLGAKQGLFVELSSAAGIVGARKLVEQGLADSNSRIVSVITASGLTSPQDIVGNLPDLVPVEPTIERLRAAFSVA